MKFKKMLMPLTGLVGLTSTLTLFVSCGPINPESIYDKPINLKDLIKNGTSYPRLTSYCQDITSLNDTIASLDYATRINQNHNIFLDDLFEVIATSPYWKNPNNELEGNLKVVLNGAKRIDVNPNYYTTISADATMDNVVVKLNDSPNDIEKIGFNGAISFVNVPFNVYYDGKWRIKADTNAIETFEQWVITINGTATIKFIGGNEQTETLDNLLIDFQTIFEKEIADVEVSYLLSLVYFDLPYYKNVKYE